MEGGERRTLGNNLGSPRPPFDPVSVVMSCVLASPPSSIFAFKKAY